MIRYQSPGTGCGRCLARLCRPGFILRGLTRREQTGGKAKPNTAAQSAERKAQKAAWEAGQGKKPDSDDDDDDNSAKRRAQQGKTWLTGVSRCILSDDADLDCAPTEKKILADARAAAGKKGAMSLGNQGIKKSGKK